MIAAIDIDLMAARPEVEQYARDVAGALLGSGTQIDRVLVLTNSLNHARFEPLRDERCDVAMVHRPLFEGRIVADWSDLLCRHPRTGAELLADHLAAKLRIVRELGADVIHFPGDAAEAMDLHAPVVVSIHGNLPSGEPACPLSATLAHAVLLDSHAARQRLCDGSNVSWAKAFVAQPPPNPQPISAEQLSTPAASCADDENWNTADLQQRREAFAAAIREAYEHALASFELRNAA